MSHQACRPSRYAAAIFASHETDSSVVEAADLCVQGVDEAVLVLTALAARFAR